MECLKKYFDWSRKIARDLLDGKRGWEDDLRDRPELQKELQSCLSPEELQKGLEVFRDIDIDRAIVRIKNRVRRNRFRRWSMAGLKVASVLVFGIIVILWMNKESIPEKKSVLIAEKLKTPYLLIGEFKKIDLLDSIAIEQQGVTIQNSGGQKLSYSGSSEKKVEKAEINTLVIPKGCEYYVELSDGTKVWLNTASELSYPIVFDTIQRAVELKGEAYFEVAKSGTPFVVKTRDMDIRVLGTEFNVMAYADESTVEVTLEKGSVQVNTGKREVLLAPGQQAVLGKTDSMLRVDEVDTKIYTAWRTGEFVFGDEPLERVGRKLERWYDVHVLVDSTLLHKSLNGSLRRYDSILECCQMLALTDEIEVVYREDTIEILPRKER